MPIQGFNFDNWVDRNINFLQEKWYQYISKDIRENKYKKPGVQFLLTSNKIQLTDDMSVRFYAELTPHPYILKHLLHGYCYATKTMYYYDIQCNYELTKSAEDLEIVSPRYRLPSPNNEDDNNHRIDPDSPTHIAPQHDSHAPQYYPYDTTPASDGIENIGASPHSAHIHHSKPYTVTGDVFDGYHL